MKHTGALGGAWPVDQRKLSLLFPSPCHWWGYSWNSSNFRPTFQDVEKTGECPVEHCQDGQGPGEKQSRTVGTVDKCVALYNNVATPWMWFHYLMLTMYIWRSFLYFWPDFQGMNTFRDRFLHGNSTSMTFHTFPRWSQLGSTRPQR